jgi:hypothetical protein
MWQFMRVLQINTQELPVGSSALVAISFIAPSKIRVVSLLNTYFVAKRSI